MRTTLTNRRGYGMDDKSFLKWIHNRLVNQHGENEHYDYMCKLRSIIAVTDNEKYTPNTDDKEYVANGKY